MAEYVCAARSEACPEGKLRSLETETTLELAGSLRIVVDRVDESDML